MKKILALLALVSTTALADGGHYNHGGYRGGYHGGGYHYTHGGGAWIGPAIIGGVIGWELGRSYPPQPPVIYSYPQQPQIIYQNPVYEYTWIYDDMCRCNRRVLVRVY